MKLRIAAILISVALAFSMLLSGSAPAEAFSLNENFKISYSAAFSTLDVHGNEPFSLNITASAVCIADLPSPYNLVTAASIESRVTAQNQATGDKVTLNPSYTLNIKKFPIKAGESSQDSQSISLQFPDGSPAGSYKVTGELVQAQVQAIVWVDATSYLPSSTTLGTVNYSLAIPTPAATTKPAPSGSATASIVPTPSPSATASSIAPSSPRSSGPTTTAAAPEGAEGSGTGWLTWVFILEVAALAAAVIALIVVSRRHR